MGHFEIDGLVWGKYKVFAKKEDAGYPDVRWSIYSANIFPTIEVTATAPLAKIRIKLGPRAGVLAGSLTNALTGAPVNAGFKLIRADSPNDWISTAVAPDYRVLLPSGTNVLLEVSAPGFKTWGLPAPINLRPGAEMRLNIQLEPFHDPTLQPLEFSVPEGYVGWLVLEHGVKDAQPTPVESGGRSTSFQKPDGSSLHHQVLSGEPKDGTPITQMKARCGIYRRIIAAAGEWSGENATVLRGEYSTCSSSLSGLRSNTKAPKPQLSIRDLLLRQSTENWQPDLR